MAHDKYKKPSDYIEPLNMNGLNGRMLRLPAPKNKTREILFIYGHHSSLERWWGVAQVLNRYGSVTMPDLPGFGGMESFYKLGKKPTTDALADYLAAFIKLRYKRKKVTIIGLSFGFVVITRMMQRCPDLVGRVDLLVSMAGFSHSSDFVFSNPRRAFYLGVAHFFRHSIPAVFFKNVLLNPTIIKTMYASTHNAKAKFANLSSRDHRAMLDFEVYLWHINDIRTHMHTSAEFLELDNLKTSINLPLHHVMTAVDQYFDAYTVEQHLKIIFPKVTIHKAHMEKHAPSLIADVKQASELFPPSLTRLLRR